MTRCYADRRRQVAMDASNLLKPALARRFHASRHDARRIPQCREGPPYSAVPARLRRSQPRGHDLDPARLKKYELHHGVHHRAIVAAATLSTASSHAPRQSHRSDGRGGVAAHGRKAEEIENTDRRIMQMKIGGGPLKGPTTPPGLANPNPSGHMSSNVMTQLTGRKISSNQVWTQCFSTILLPHRGQRCARSPSTRRSRNLSQERAARGRRRRHRVRRPR